MRQCVFNLNANSILISIHETCDTPNVAIEWVILMLLLTREIPVSNLGPETYTPDEGSRVFSQFLQANSGIVSQIRP